MCTEKARGEYVAISVECLIPTPAYTLLRKELYDCRCHEPRARADTRIFSLEHIEQPKLGTNSSVSNKLPLIKTTCTNALHACCKLFFHVRLQSGNCCPFLSIHNTAADGTRAKRAIPIESYVGNITVNHYPSYGIA